MEHNTRSLLFTLITASGLYIADQSQASMIAEDNFLFNFPTAAANGEYSGNALDLQNASLVAWNKRSINDAITGQMGLFYPGFTSSGGSMTIQLTANSSSASTQGISRAVAMARPAERKHNARRLDLGAMDTNVNLSNP
jgi:hypothetical protein